MDPHASHAYVVSALCAADPIELSDFVGCISFGDQPGIVLVKNQHVEKFLFDHGFLQREIETDFLRIVEIFCWIFPRYSSVGRVLVDSGRIWQSGW